MISDVTQLSPLSSLAYHEVISFVLLFFSLWNKKKTKKKSEKKKKEEENLEVLELIIIIERMSNLYFKKEPLTI